MCSPQSGGYPSLQEYPRREAFSRPCPAMLSRREEGDDGGIVAAASCMYAISRALFRRRTRLTSRVALLLFPSLPTGDLAMPLVARTVLPAVVGTLMLAAITAAMMSTVDSLLIVAGPALSEAIDPVPPGFLASAAPFVGVSLATPLPPPDAVAPFFD